MSDEFDKVAELAQKYVAEKPVIVLGTGATIPHGLPSMPDLAKALVDGIEVHNGEQDCNSWKGFVEALERTKDLEKALHETELSSDLLARVVEKTWRLNNQKDLQVLVRVAAEPSTLQLATLFKHLLRTANPTVSVVTTNYDRLAEYAADVAEARVFTGFSGGHIQRFLRNKCSGTPGRNVNVWKVHGSLDWFVQDSGDPLGLPLQTEIPGGCRPLIVTPGSSKYREAYTDPFRTIIACADEALETARSYLCIGYGFNDEHMQSVLKRRVREDSIPIVVVTKELSAAGRSILLDRSCSKFLILEEENTGTKAYYPSRPGGVSIPGSDLWNLGKFLDMLLAEGEKH